jgi:hypothetical protein
VFESCFFFVSISVPFLRIRLYGTAVLRIKGRSLGTLKLVVFRMSASPGGLSFEVNSSAFWHYIVELDHVMTWQDDGGEYTVKRLGAGDWKKRRESRCSQGSV